MPRESMIPDHKRSKRDCIQAEEEYREKLSIPVTDPGGLLHLS